MFRHADAEVVPVLAQRQVRADEKSTIPTRGERKIRMLGLNPYKIGVSTLDRAHTTAKLFTQRLGVEPKLVEYDFLDEISSQLPPELTRFNLISMLQGGSYPTEYPAEGESIIKQLTKDTDPEINLFFTHGSVLAAVKVARLSNAKPGESIDRQLVVPPLGHVKLNLE